MGSIFITPWNLYNNPQVIHYTLDILGSFIGPLFGILIADYYFVRRQQVAVDDLYTMQPEGRYWYRGGYNPRAVMTMVPAALVPILCVVVPSWRGAANYA
ncbi:nitrate reductase, partial [Azospirillum brasilense]|uniref:cytosine permease n=1 Tax=Azospirillum brasilense TaxID=192 RepID=UPI0009D291B2